MEPFRIYHARKPSQDTDLPPRSASSQLGPQARLTDAAHLARLEAHRSRVQAELARQSAEALQVTRRACDGCGAMAPGCADTARRHGWLVLRRRGWWCPECREAN